MVAVTRDPIAAWTGALDVRRVAPERRANEFPLEPGAHALPISVPRAVRKPRRLTLGANPASKEKVPSIIWSAISCYTKLASLYIRNASLRQKLVAASDCVSVMAALPASLVVAIVTALLVLAAAVRTGRVKPTELSPG